MLNLNIGMSSGQVKKGKLKERSVTKITLLIQKNKNVLVLQLILILSLYSLSSNHTTRIIKFQNDKLKFSRILSNYPFTQSYIQNNKHKP